MKVFFDLETTGIDHHSCEIVEAFFVSQIGELHFYNKPVKWSVEAEQVHKIPWDKVKDQPSINENLDLLFSYLRKIPKPIEFWCYANTNSFVNGVHTYCHFDLAVLHNNASLSNRLFEFRHVVKGHTVNSVHTLAKKVLPHLKGGYSQANVANYFGIEYDAHKAKDDVMCMIEIYKKLQTYGSQELLLI